MAEIQTLTATLSADVAQFLAGMQAAQAHAAQVNRALEGMAGVTHAAARAHEEHAGAIGKSVEMYHLAAEAVLKVVEGVKQFAESTIEANNVINPRAARQWNESVDELKNSFMRFAGAIGSQVEPVIEAGLHKVSQGFTGLTNTDWAPLLDGLRDVGAKLAPIVKGWADAVMLPWKLMYDAAAWAMGQVVSVYQKFKDTIDPIAKTIADFLMKPFQLMTEFALSALAEVSAALGKALDFIKDKTGEGPGGGGLRSLAASLDALNQKVKQDFGGSLVGAVKDAASSVRAVLQPALDGAAKTFDSFKRGTGMKAADVNDAGEIALMEAAKHRAEEIGKLYDRVMGKTAANQLSNSMRELELVRQGADLREKTSNYEYQEAIKQAQLAKGIFEDSGAAYSKAQAAAEAIGQSIESAIGAVRSELVATEQAFKAQREDEMRSAQAVADFKEKAESALAANKLKTVKDEERARNDAAIAHYQILLQQLNQDRMFRQQTEAMVGAKRMELQKAEFEARMQAEKRLHEYRLQLAKQMTAPADKVSGAIGGITQNVVGNASNAFAETAAATGNPLAAAGAAAKAAAEALLENSAGFKKLQGAINGVMQQVSDAVGAIFEPLVPLVELVGQTLKPILEGIAGILRPIGQMLANALRPFVTMLGQLLSPLASILAPIGKILSSLAPLIGPIQQISMLIMTIEQAFDPFTIALRTLAPVLEFVAKVIKFVVDGIAVVWNGILHVLEGVFDSLAHALPAGAGDAMRDVYNALVGMEIHTEAIGGAADSSARQIKTLGEAAQSSGGIFGVTMRAAKALADQQSSTADALAAQYGGRGLIGVAMDAMATQANHVADAFATTTEGAHAFAAAMDYATNKLFDNALAKLLQDQQTAYDDAQALQYAKDSGASAAVIKALGDKVAADNNQVTIDTFRTNAAGMTGKGAQAQLSQAIIAETSATVANTKATNSLIASLTNAPSGFRAAMYEYAASSVSSSRNPALTGAAQKVAGQTVQHGGIINGPVTIQVVSTDPATAGKAVEKTLREWNFRTSGQPVLAGGGKHA